MSASKLDVVILCGGLGTRLQSVVKDRPKPMADIAGKPFMVLLLEHMMKFGFSRFVLCIGYKAEVAEKLFESANLPCEIVFSREDKPLGTAGALAAAVQYTGSNPVVVLNGDSFCAVDYAIMLSRHTESSADVTVAVTPPEGRSDVGNVYLAQDGRVTAFNEKRPGDAAGLVNAGIYVFSRKALESMEKRVPLSLEKDVFPAMTKERFFGHRVAGPIIDIGTPERYEDARKNLIRAMGEGGGMKETTEGG